MTSKADWKKSWGADKHQPHDRRARLNELGALPDKDDELWREHDALAEIVANDEDAAAEIVKEEEEKEHAR